MYYKWRFYFTDYTPVQHTPVFHLEWQFGHIEYDVPQAPAGTAPEDAVHTLTTRFTLNDFMDGGHGANCNVQTDYYCADPTKVRRVASSLPLCSVDFAFALCSQKMRMQCATRFCVR